MLRNLSSDEMFVLPPKGMKHIVRGHFTPEEISPRGSIEIEDFENRVTRLIATAKKKGDRK